MIFRHMQYVGEVPAKVIKYRFSEDIIDEMKKIDYSKLNEKMIRENINRLYEEITDKSQIDWLPKNKVEDRNVFFAQDLEHHCTIQNKKNDQLRDVDWGRRPEL